MSIQVTVKLSEEELLLDIRNKSQQELADIADAQQQYHSVAGTDKDEDVSRSLQEAVHFLRSLCHEFLVDTLVATVEVDDEPETYSSGNIEITLGLSDRRDGSLLTHGIALAMHGYLVEKSLELYYGSTPARDLAVLHAARAATCESEVMRLLYRKRKPVYEAAPAIDDPQGPQVPDGENHPA